MSRERLLLAVFFMSEKTEQNVYCFTLNVERWYINK